jgi:sulfite dehydrogenase (cytochrome) subunit B
VIEPMRLTPRIAILAAILGAAGAVLAQQGQQRSIKLPADDPTSQLKPGAGDALASRNCALCHSLDYIVRQPRLDSTQWEAEVRRMIMVYGAPINDVDAKAISGYLATSYGAQTPANPPGARPAN